eukprot:GFUD01021886.1.p1 GENE.GFUD01021886.1~~GFUD01021886.1.p1  ORF type:complete len:486 (-),score=114.09 GFUD01021886.1:176-1633(-)
MNSSFFQSQHPVVEELLTNKYFGDTLLVCANGHLTDNKLAVGLLFPCLLTSDIFALPIENVLLVPDYTMEEIGREFEKLIIGGNCKINSPETETVEKIDLIELEDDDVVSEEEHLRELGREYSHEHESVSFSPSEIEEAELVIDESPPEVHVEVDIENGYDENCHNIEIGESTVDSIQIFVSEEAPLDEETGPPDLPVEEAEVALEHYSEDTDGIQVIETDLNPLDIQIELFSNNENVNIVDENNANTDGGIVPVIKPERAKKYKTVTFKEDLEEHMLRRPRVKRWKQTKLKLKVEEGCQDVIENLPTLPDLVESSGSPEKSPRRSPKKESPILENRKPGRPRTKPEQPNLRQKLSENGLTRYKVKSAEWKAIELYKCAVCAKVLSCRGSFERHSRMHQDTKPYKCSFCPKTFREACKKSVHERVHSGSKPYPCQQCNKSFRTATQRIVHQRSHTKEKPYSCEVCGKVFSQPYSVKVHMQRFHKS